jgi:hypothetical protein
MFYETIANIFSTKDYKTPWEWAEDNVFIDKTSSYPGKFKSSTAPWTKELMEVFADNEVRELAIMCSAQSGKTQALMVLAAWAISEDPGPLMWVMAAQDEAEDFMKTRLFPTLNQCPTIRNIMPTERGGRRKGTIDFPSMPMMVRGAGSPSKLQSVPVRWLILDEVRNYPPGALEMVRKRVRAQWNSKIAMISTPANENDAVHQAFLDGDQRHPYWACMACSKKFTPKWENIVFEESEKTKVDGRWLFDALASTIRLKCPECGHEHVDEPFTRKKLANSIEWVPHNAAAPKHKVSFSWNSIIPPWVRWRDIVEEFLVAKRQSAFGNILPLKEWQNETMGEPWRERNKETLFADATQATEYEAEKTFGGRIFLTVDVQKNCVWFVAREWYPGGASRLIEYGSLPEIDSIVDIIKKYEIENGNVLIDSGYETQLVYQKTIQHASPDGSLWKPTKGHDNPNGYHWKGVRQPYMWSIVDAMMSRGEKKTLRLLVFSNPLIKEALLHLMSGHGAKWEFSKRVTDEYIAQINAEKREERIDAFGRISYVWRRVRKDNHLFDCEAMQVLAALASKIIGQDLPKTNLTNLPVAEIVASTPAE